MWIVRGCLLNMSMFTVYLILFVNVGVSKNELTKMLVN